MKICGMLFGAKVESEPSAVECGIVANLWHTRDAHGLSRSYFDIICALMLAGF